MVIQSQDHRVDDTLPATPTRTRKLRIALFAEAVTLAHVARPVALARALGPEGHEMMLACDPRYSQILGSGPWSTRDLHSISGSQFNLALARGAPVYDLKTLQSYVREDLAILEAYKPDVVVGDFRLSLSVSARLARIPYLAIANAYWSPHYRGGFELPVLPMTKVLPIPAAKALFHLFRPMAFAMHCRPMNRLRTEHGLPPLGHDLRHVYTDADHLLMPDIPHLYPVDDRASDCSYTGPLTWSPAIDLPDWWDEPAPVGSATIYVTLGSSGPSTALLSVLQALDGLPVHVIASTAGAATPLPSNPKNVRLAPYLPGDAAAHRSQLMICNGGSLSTQQAFAAGIPVLGICSNMDHFLNMAPIEQAGVGLRLRADRLSMASIRQATQTLLASDQARAAARQLQASLLRPGFDTSKAFKAAVAAVSSRSRRDR